MALNKKLVYVVTAYFPVFDELGDCEDFEEFYVDSLDAAEILQDELLETGNYVDVYVSDFIEERVIFV